MRSRTAETCGISESCRPSARRRRPATAAGHWDALSESAHGWRKENVQPAARLNAGDVVNSDSVDRSLVRPKIEDGADDVIRRPDVDEGETDVLHEDVDLRLTVPRHLPDGLAWPLLAIAKEDVTAVFDQPEIVICVDVSSPANICGREGTPDFFAALNSAVILASVQSQTFISSPTRVSDGS